MSISRAQTQTELEIEQHVLSQTKKLSDGTFEKIFVRNPRVENGMYSYNCRLCGVANLNGERALQTHITGRKHQQRLVFDYIPDAFQFRNKIAATKQQPIIHPGEPIPPGFEDLMPRESYLSTQIINVEKPLIGLEYVAELLDPKAKEPFYVCMLCDKRCDPRNIIAQVTSHRHRMKYLDFHFPSTMKILNVNKKFNLDMAFREEVLTHVTREIETVAGRKKLPIFDYKDFEKRRNEIFEETKNAPHFCEADFPNSEKILLEKFNMKESEGLDEVSSDSDEEFSGIAERKTVRFGDKRLPAARERARDHRDESYRHDFLSHMAPHVPPKRFATPRELMEQSNQKMQERYLVEKYKTLLEYAVKEIDQRYKEHEKSPENHPKYSHEWKEFWARRYKELIADGKDANGHDYRPEWIAYWTKRMASLHTQEVEAKKKEIQKKLKLSADEVKKIERSRTRSRSKSPPRKRPSRSPIEISDDSNSDSDGHSRPRAGPSTFKMAKRRPNHEETARSRSHSHHSNSPHRRRERTRSPSSELEEEKDINLVTVCRLLSVLETELGILAPKVIELLSRALALEKSAPNSCDNLLLASDNMLLMETAKEKLKGGLHAGLVAREKVAVVKRAITNIAKLVYAVNERKPKMIVEERKEAAVQGAPSSSSSGGLSAEEKARQEIARVIAGVLAEQGKEDLPADELEKLIESFLSESVSDVDEEMREEPARQQQKEMEEKQEKEAEEEKAKAEEKRKEEEATQSLENLTDEDLKTLLRNFSELTSDEQNHLIAYLSKIERSQPSRVEKLRKYVDIGDEEIQDEDMDADEAKPKSPPAARHDISDDEYADETTAPQQSAIGNPQALANDLLSSLNSAVMSEAMPMPVQDAWEPMQTPFSSFMTPAYSHSQLMMQQEMYAHHMEANMMASSWPQTSAVGFMDEGGAGKEYGGQRFNASSAGHVPYRKRHERTNNLQLTGKGAKKQN